MNWKAKLDHIKSDIEDVADTLNGEDRDSFLRSLEEAVASLQEFPDEVQD